MNKKTKKCEQCGQPIAQARLEALPDATRCIDCAKKDDQPMRQAFLEPDSDAPHPRGW